MATSHYSSRTLLLLEQASDTLTDSCLLLCNELSTAALRRNHHILLVVDESWERSSPLALTLSSVDVVRLDRDVTSGVRLPATIWRRARSASRTLQRLAQRRPIARPLLNGMSAFLHCIAESGALRVAVGLTLSSGRPWVITGNDQLITLTGLLGGPHLRILLDVHGNTLSLRELTDRSRQRRRVITLRVSPAPPAHGDTTDY